jgi:hypothetical protein
MITAVETLRQWTILRQIAVLQSDIDRFDPTRARVLDAIAKTRRSAAPSA